MEILTRTVLGFGSSDPANLQHGVSIPRGHKLDKEEKVLEFVTDDIIIIANTNLKISEIKEMIVKLANEI